MAPEPPALQPPHRRLVVFADGTWNTAEQERNGQPVPTNVTRMFRGVAPVHEGVSQLKYYQRGVGTRWGVDRLAGGAFGKGLSDNIIDCYRWLIANYAEGDQIFLFGFSRGAYTVRSLAGLIRNSGLPRTDNLEVVQAAYQLYRDRDEKNAPSLAAAVAFRAQHSREVDIEMIGVWDTVGALGVPGYGFRLLNRKKYDFHDVQLSSRVRHAFQALAVDERRRAFRPSLWAIPDDHPGTLEQVWFAGVHCNVGGGYRQDESCLSNLTLRWMVDRAKRCGLGFVDPFPGALTDENGWPDNDDEIHVHDSLTLFYRTLGGGWEARTICGEDVGEDGKPLMNAKGELLRRPQTVHDSVRRLLRRAVPHPRTAYTPSNLPASGPVASGPAAGGPTP